MEWLNKLVDTIHQHGTDYAQVEKPNDLATAYLHIQAVSEKPTIIQARIQLLAKGVVVIMSCRRRHRLSVYA